MRPARTFEFRRRLVASTGKPHYFQACGHWWVLRPYRTFADPLQS